MSRPALDALGLFKKLGNADSSSAACEVDRLMLQAGEIT
jgi:hypothetical protein